MTATHLPDARSVGSTRSLTRRSGLRWERVATVLGLSFVVSCGSSGMGCGGLGKIKGGYPVDQRLDSAISLRVTGGFFDFLSQNGGTLIGKILPPGGIPVPSTCSGSTQICCGQMCTVDLTYSSLTFVPQASNTTTLVATLAAGLKTNPDFKVTLPVVGTCTVSVDTSRTGNPASVGLPIITTVDSGTDLTSINFDPKNLSLSIDDGALKITGGLLCKGIGIFKGTLINVLTTQIQSLLSGPLTGLLCQTCKTADDCSSLADGGCAMSNGKNVCMHMGTCMQHLGVEGNINLGATLGKLPGGSKDAALDIYAVAGSYATVEPAPTSGLSLGLLGGSFTPAVSSCVPPRPVPTPPAPLGKTDAYAGNTAPNGMPYHIGAGISSLELDTLGHSFYTTGGLCLSIGTDQVSELSSGLVSALVPSLADLTRGNNAALQIVIRPQNPPTFTLGKGTFKTNGMGQTTIDDPLLTLQIKDLALDFYVYMDERMVRFMRHTADVSVPLGLDIDNMGQIVPMLGDLSMALSNVRVTDSELLAESPTQLANLLPSLLPIVLGSISNTLNPIKLPSILGMPLVPVQFTSTPDSAGNLAYLGLFLQFQPPAMMSMDGGLFSDIAPQNVTPSVETYAQLVALDVPTARELRQGSSANGQPAPTVRATLMLDAQSPTKGSIEYQYRVDAGLWRPFDGKRQIVVDDASLKLPGSHTIDVRARVAGSPYSLDPTPASVSFNVAPSLDDADTATMPNQNAAGCQMSGGRPDAKEHRGHSGLIFLVVGMLSILGLSRRRPARFTLFTAAVLGFAGFSPTGCGNDSQDQNNNMMMGGNNMPHPELNPSDEIGRYQSAVSANNNVYISAYDTTMGDLAFTTVGFSAAPTAMLTWLPVDGLPTGNPMDTSSTAYRGGYTDPGPDVGRFTSLALTSAGLPVIAYQDVTNGAVKLAIQTSAGGQTMQGGQAMPTWQISTLTAPTEGKLPGSYISMVLDPSDTPTVAYMVQGVRKADSSMTSQLVVAHAGSASPTGSDGWQKTIVAEVPTSCAGLCGMNEACVYADPTKPSMVATICQTVDTSCTPSCKSGQACMAGKCVAAFGTPAEEEPLGTGLYANLVNAGANTVVFFHDSTVGALNMAQSPDWKVTTLAGGDGMTVAGKGIGAAAAPDGTLHVAYGNDQSQVQYLAISGGMPGTVEMVDDGTRMVNGLPEMHPVGGGLYLFIDGGQPAVAYQDQMAVTLETARRGDMTGWTHATLSMNNMQGRGFYPQAVSSNNQWLVLDVAYDRSANALSSVAFSPM